MTTVTGAEPVAYLYTRDDGSKDLLLSCNGEYARNLLEAGATETPLYATPQAQTAVVEALREAREVFALAAKPAHLDPDKHFTSQVQGLGDAFGYGALMTCASALWRQRLGELAGGEFAAGPCVITIQKQIDRIDAALSLAGGDV
jgi:hypothetical protein